MSEVLKIQRDIDIFYNQKENLKILNDTDSKSIINFEKVTNLKKDFTQKLSEILLSYGESFLDSSFYFQVNNIEQAIFNVIKEKEQKEIKLIDARAKMFEIAKDTMKYIYSIDILENSITTSYGIEKRLLDIKNAVKMIDNCKKRTYALTVIKEKFEIYKEEYIKLIELLKSNKSKDELSFNKKQEVLDLISRISLKDNTTNSRIFYDSDEEDTKVSDYLKLYEHSFLEICLDIGLNLKSYYEEVKFLFNNNKIFFSSISNKLDFIFKDYENTIEKFEYEQQIKMSKAMLEIKELLGYCCIFESNMNLDKLLDDIQNEKELPNYLYELKNIGKLKNLMFEMDVKMKDSIGICNVLDELRDNMESLFENDKYLDIFGFYLKQKSNQLNEYRNYYSEILKKSKEEVKRGYLKCIDELLEDEILDNYSTISVNISKEKNSEEIVKLKSSLQEINLKYRKFDDENRYLYIKSIQDKYKIDNLCEMVIEHKKKIMDGLKIKKNMQDKEKIVAYDFFYEEKFEEALRKEIIEDLFLDEEKLRARVICNIKKQ